MARSVVVTGGARGVGAAIAKRLRSDGWGVVVVDLEGGDVTGDAADPDVAKGAADAAEKLGTLTGWVNNAALFSDAWLHEEPARVLESIAANLVPAVVGSAVAVARFVAGDTKGSIVNV